MSNENISSVRFNPDGIRSRLKRLREDDGLTQQQLADKIHCSRENISNYERGENTLSFDSLAEYMNVFHVSADYILFGIEHESNNMKSDESVAYLIADLEALIQKYMCK